MSEIQSDPNYVLAHSILQQKLSHRSPEEVTKLVERMIDAQHDAFEIYGSTNDPAGVLEIARTWNSEELDEYCDEAQHPAPPIPLIVPKTDPTAN